MTPRAALALLLAAVSTLAPGPAPAQPAAGTARPPAGAPAAGPAIPDGWRWHEHVATRGRYVVPKGWHVQESTHDGVHQLTISEEPAPPESTRLQAAFTVHVFARPQDRKANGVQMVDAWIAHLKSLKGAQVSVRPRTLGPFSAREVMAAVPTGASPGTPAFRLGGLAAVNVQTGAVYIARFEAPESSPEATWDVAPKMLGLMTLETEY